MIMPEMSGGKTFDMLKEIKPTLKVLLASGYSLNGEAKAILARGCDGFIQKPFSIGEISRKIREVLDRQEVVMPCLLLYYSLSNSTSAKKFSEETI